MFEGTRWARGERFGGPKHRRTRVGRRLKRRGFLAFEPLERRDLLATFVVDSLGDGSDGDFSAGKFTLREAVIRAADTSGADTIEFAPSLTGTITLSGNPINIVSDVTITGSGADQLAISGNNNSRIFKVFSFASAQISGLTIRNGRFADGGAILNEGTLTLTNSIVTSNSATVSSGGGIYVATGARLSVVDTMISGNSANAGGGGIQNDGSLTITNSTISGNSATNGGGVGSQGASLTITNSTISGNSAQNGGGLLSQGASLTITNSTISGNSATDVGGGLLLQNAGTFTNVTVTNNQSDSDNNGSGTGGGIFQIGAGSLLQNTLVAGNFRGTGAARDDINGPLNSAGSFNLIGDGAGMTGLSHGTAGNLIGTNTSPIDPRLDALADNGGPTLTHALLTGSPAIDAGNNSDAPSADQRGVARLQDGNSDGTAVVDIGAYEFEVTNQDPVANAGGPYTLRAGANLSLDGSASTEPDSGDQIVNYEWDLNDDGNYEIPSVNPTAVVTWATLSALNPRLQYPADPVTGLPSNVVRLRVTDSFGGMGLASTTLTIFDETPPTITGAADVRVQTTRPDGAIVQYTVRVTDNVDPAPSLSCVPPSGSRFPIGATTVTCQATDASGNRSTTSFVITVESAGPTFMPGDVSVAENTTDVLTLTATDDLTPAADITFAITAGADAASFEIDASDPAAEKLTFRSAPSFESPGSADSDNIYEVQVTATDTDGQTTARTILVTVTDVDEFDVSRPVDTDNAADAVAENSPVGTTVGVTAFASDEDGSNNTVTYSLPGSAGGLFSIDANTGVVRVAGSLDHETGASQMITVRATSSDGSMAHQSFTIAVTDANDAPVAVPGGPYSVPEGGTLTLNGSISFDPDGDALTFAWDLDKDGNFGESSTVRGDERGAMPTFSALGRDGPEPWPIALRVGDGARVSEATATINIANVAPTILAFNVPDTGKEGQAIEVSAVADDAAGTADPLTFSWRVTGPGLFLSTSSKDLFSFTPPDSGFYDVRLTVSDGDGGTKEESRKIDVANLAPTAKVIASPASVNEGGATLISFTMVEDVPEDAGKKFSFSYDWDNDGVFGEPGELGNGTYAGGTKNDSAIAPAELFADGPGERTIRARITDKDNGSTDYEAKVEILNVAPMIDVPKVPAMANEGDTVTFEATATDPGGANDPLTFTWTVTRPDGKSDLVNGSSATYTVGNDGIYGVSLSVSDDDGGVAAPPSPVTITVANLPPTANAQTVNAEEDLDKNITLTGSDPGNDALALRIVSLPLNGALFDGNNEITAAPFVLTGADVTYRGNQNFNGTDSFIFTVFDGTSEDLTPAVVSINVASVNGAPQIASPLMVTTPEDTAKAITLAASDADGDSLTFAIVSGPAHGMLSAISGHQIVYTPELNYNGPDSFQFKASDGFLESNMGDVRIDITPVNDLPVAHAGGPYSVHEGEIFTLVGSASDPDGQPLTFEWDLIYDAVRFDSDTIGARPTVSFPDDFAARTIALRVTDSAGETDIATTTLEVTNVAPMASAGADLTVDEGSKVTLNGTFSDPGTADTHSFLWEVSASNGQVIANGKEQDFSFTPFDNGKFTVAFTVSDDDQGTGSDTVVVTVRNVAPTITGAIAPATASEGQTVQLSATATDPAGDRDSLAYDWTITGPDNFTALRTGQGVDVTLARDGGYTYVLAVRDDDGGVTSLGPRTIFAANLPPTANPGGPYTVDRQGKITLQGSATDPGGPTEPLTFLWDLDGDMKFGETGLDAQRGDEVGATPTFDAAELPGGSRFTVFLRVEDDDGASESKAVEIAVIGNDPPTANDQVVAAEEDVAKTITLTGGDPGNDPLEFRIVSLPLNGMLLDGATEIAPAALPFTLTGSEVTYRGRRDFNGNNRFTFTVFDGFEEDQTPATVAIDVTPVKDAPFVANPVNDVMVDEDAADTVLDLSATFADVDIATNADSLTLSVTNNSNPSLAAATLAGTTLTLDYQPNLHGQADITVRATDKAGAFVEDTFRVTVKLVNEPPVADAGADQTVECAAPGASATFSVNGAVSTDSDGTIVSYFWAFPGGTAAGVNPTITLGVGVHTVVLTVTDDSGASDTDDVTIMLVADTIAPTAPGPLVFSNAAKVVGGIAYDSDAQDGTTADGGANFTLTWAASTENCSLSHYSVERATDTSFATGLETATVTGTTAHVGPLPDGTYFYRVKAFDAAGNASITTGPVQIVVDSTPPATPGAADLAADDDSGASNTDNITSNTRLTLDGSTEANATVKIFDGATRIATTTADGSGDWTLDVTLVEGSHPITFTATDVAGNESGASPALALVIDTTAPAAPIVNIVPAIINLANQASIDITVNGETGATVTSASATVTSSSGVTGTSATTLSGMIPATNVVTAFAATVADNGTLTATARQTDAAGNESTSAGSDTAVFDTVNDPPVADAGGPYSGEEGRSFVLDGTRSNDEEVIRRFEWDLDYDGVTVRVDVTGARPTVSFDDDFRPRTIALRVTDSDGLTDIDTTTLEIMNLAPTAVNDRLATKEDVSVSVTVSMLLANDSDPAGPLDPLTITGVTQASNGAVTVDAQGNITYTPDQDFNGVDRFTYAVTDGDGGQATANVDVVVDPAADPPVADTGGPYTIGEGTDVKVDASASFDRDEGRGDRIVKYEWDLNGDGQFDGVETSATGAVHTFVWDSLAGLGLGTHPITLRVTDSSGLSSTAQTRLVIFDNTPPDTRITLAPPALGNSRSAVFEFASDDTSPGVRFEWHQTGGPFRAATGNRVELSELVDGEHTFEVRAVDAAGNADPTPATVTFVVDASPPIVEISPPGGTYAPGTSYRVRVDGSLPDSSPGQLLVIKNGVPHALDGTGSATMSPGTNVVTVLATDQVGNSTIETRVYTVMGAAVVDGNLIVAGTAGVDSISIRAAGMGLELVVNGVAQRMFVPSGGEVILHGGDGDDIIRADMLRQNVRLFGGNGNDILIAGRGNDVLVGGAGDDLLFGGLGRDLLIGGEGRDHLIGNGAILINGTTAYDGDAEALALILEAWSDPAASYAARVALIEAGVGDERVRLDSRADSRTVFDDAEADTLIGRDQILDWFFAELGRDAVVSPVRGRLPARA